MVLLRATATIWKNGKSNDSSSSIPHVKGPSTFDFFLQKITDSTMIIQQQQKLLVDKEKNISDLNGEIRTFKHDKTTLLEEERFLKIKIKELTEKDLGSETGLTKLVTKNTELKKVS